MDNELTHHGVKGQKWGVIRTPKQLGHPELNKKKTEPKKLSKKELKKKAKAEALAKSNSYKEMSDDELKRAIERARNEDTYRSLRPQKVSPGKTFVKSIAADVLAPALKSAGRDFVETALKKYTKELFKDAVDPNSFDSIKRKYEKLDYLQKIDRIQNPDKYITWDDRIKKQTWEDNEAKRKEKKS